MSDENQSKSSIFEHPLASFGMNVGKGLLGTAVQHTLNSREAQKAFDRQKKLLRMEFDYNQKAQRNAPLNTRLGLEKAGINPALMNEGNFAPAGASASGAPSAQVSVPDFGGDISTMSLQSAQAENLRASNENISTQNALLKEQENAVRLENEKREIEISRMRDADTGVNENMLEHLRKLKDIMTNNGVDASEIQSKIDAIEKGDRSYTMGALLMNDAFEKFRAQVANNIPAYSEAEGRLKVAELRKKNPKVFEALALAPQKEQDKIEAEISKIYRDAYNAQMSGNLNAKKVDEIQANINKVVAETKSILQDAKSRYLNDPRLLIADEEYGKLGTYLGMDAYEKATGVLTTLLGQKFGGQVAGDLKQLDAELEANKRVETMREVVTKGGEKIPTREVRTTHSWDDPKNVRKKSRRSGHK